MKVLSSSTTNKTLTGCGMDSVIELPLLGNAGSAPPTEMSRQEAQTEPTTANQEGRRSLFSFRLKRSSTHSGLPLRPEPRTHLLFGQPLPVDGTLPRPITEVLVLLWRKGLNTEGVFRKACNSKNLSAVRDQLDSGASVDMEALPVVLLVGLLKTFLRELPGSLLGIKLYDEWVEALEKGNVEEMRRMVEKLPEANALLLQLLLCLLHHISQHSERNLMDSKNLAVCIGPTLLLDGSQTLDLARVEKVTNLIQFLIENCCEVFGERLLTLLGEPEEEELGDNSDSVSSHQHDSAYDSTDPDGDGESGEVQEEEEEGALGNSQIRIECTSEPSCSSAPMFTKPFNRRCSEPTIFSSGAMRSLQVLARSQDDCSSAREEYEGQLLMKPISDNSLLHPQSCHRSLNRKFAGSFNLNPAGSVSAPVSKAGSCSSNCSLESTASENVFVSASSPVPSPGSPRKSQTASKPRADATKPDTDSRRHSSPFKRAKSLGSFSITRGSTKKIDSQKEAAFSCETLQEDSQNEAVGREEPMRRQRPLSAIEVFQHVDSRMPSCPPSYDQAVLSGALPRPPQYRKMTVYDAMELGRKSRPISMNDCILDSCPAEQFTDLDSIGLSDCSEGQQRSFRQRAMSESVARSRVEKVSRRCSQPVFEELSYAKESYV